MVVEANWWIVVAPIVISAVSLAASVFVYRDSHRSKLKPLLLIEGMMDWNKMVYVKDKDGNFSGKVLNIRAVKNIPLDIEGRLVKEGVSYQLIFANDATKIEDKDGLWNYVPGWRWLPENGLLWAMYDSESPATKPAPGVENNIYISYRDIEGNTYHLNVNSEYVQKIERGTR